MRRILVPLPLLLMAISSLTFLFLLREGMVSYPAPTTPSLVYHPLVTIPDRPGDLVAAQEVADRFGVAITHPRNRGRTQEMRLYCGTLSGIEHCEYYVYYADGSYLWVAPLMFFEYVEPDWQDFWVADDTRGITRKVTVQGQEGIGWGPSSGDEMDPDGWPGFVRWYDPSKNLMIHLIGPYGLQQLVDIANGPWCTLATTAAVEPPVPFC